jgi:hypothetical protein
MAVREWLLGGRVRRQPQHRPVRGALDHDGAKCVKRHRRLGRSWLPPLHAHRESRACGASRPAGIGVSVSNLPADHEEMPTTVSRAVALLPMGGVVVATPLPAVGAEELAQPGGKIGSLVWRCCAFPCPNRRFSRPRESSGILKPIRLVNLLEVTDF